MNLHKSSGVLCALCGALLSSSIFAAEVIDTNCGIVTTSIMPSGDRTHSGNTNFSSVIGFDYDTRGYEPPATPAPIQMASATEVGTVWGKAYDATNQKLYVAAFLRRHAPLSPDGLGAIYEIDVSDTSSDATIGAPSLWMDLNSTAHLGSGATLFPNETDANRGLNSPFSPSYDVWAFDKVGRQGIGGLELSDDYSTMYAMDLTNRQILVIDVASKTVTAQHSIGQQYVADDLGCRDLADVRPFGVDYLDGDVYVGVSCSDETDKNGNADATAHVMRLSGTTFSEVVNGGLRGYYWSHYWDLDPSTVGCSASDRNAYVPMVTNMELDESGNMMIGVMGVNGWRYASDNYAPDTGCTSLLGEHSVRGFVLHATPNVNNWDVAATEEVQGGTYTARYADGQFVHWGAGNSHTYQGGMSMTSCSGEEVAIVNLMDPMNHESGGTRWMRTSDAQQEAHEPSDGTVTDADIIVAERSTLELYEGNNTGDNWEKSAGLGDIEYLRNAPVTCSITASANVSACTNVGADTDASNDTFNIDITVEGSNTGASTSYTYTSDSANISGGGTYSASPETDGAFTITATTSPFSLNIVDSANPACSTTVSNLTAPATCSGSNPQVDLEISKTVSPTSAVSGDTVIYTVTVNNNGVDDATGVVVNDPLPVGVTYVSDDGGIATSESSGVVTWNLGNLVASGNATLNITVTVD